ncbi:long-chain fatty acid transport protein 1-like [Clytia hemisphaerica]|uniref:long-chain fatty acid transport protein 1-like n=1 Tax=Clytia hemisphaerica TaxID=252671 RepID=UPI0034D68A70
MAPCNPWKVFGYVSLLYYFYSIFGIQMSFLLVGSLVYLTDGLKDLTFAKRIIIRDCYWAFITMTRFVPKLMKNKKKSPNQLFSEVTQKHPNKKALIDAETGRSLSFNEIQIFVNKIGRVFNNSGYKPGDKIALFLGNELEYVPIWLGLNKVGIQVGKINYNLHGKSLEHCLSIVDYRAVICAPDFVKTLENISFHEKSVVEIFIFGEESFEGDYKDLNGLIKDEQDSTAVEGLDMNPNDFSILQYTSGSTGFPKAVAGKSGKFVKFCVFHEIMMTKSDDIVYNCLPLYHTTGGVLGMTPLFWKGCSTVIRKKFSASKFILDCIKYDVTWVGYVGELWKYLLSQPVRDTDRRHKIKYIHGNGLRKNLVPLVKGRFGIDRIGEIYGATEGNTGLLNLENVPGAVGFYYFLFPFLNQNCLVKADVETGEIIRDENGRAILCKPGEVGALIGIVKKGAEYNGYVNNEKETNKKLKSNLFKEGDSAFISGDLLVMDEYRNVFFVDRIGDTFRWRGENVATTEVENIMSSVVSTAEDVVVYPVPIPGEGGNAGMAYIREKENQQFSIKGVAQSLLEELPKYAIPMFIRVGRNLDQTGTFKYQKSALKKEKYDLKSCNKDDVIYVYDVTNKDYVILDAELQQNIEDGNMRF